MEKQPRGLSEMTTFFMAAHFVTKKKQLEVNVNVPFEDLTNFECCILTKTYAY